MLTILLMAFSGPPAELFNEGSLECLAVKEFGPCVLGFGAIIKASAERGLRRRALLESGAASSQPPASDPSDTNSAELRLRSQQLHTTLTWGLITCDDRAVQAVSALENTEKGSLLEARLVGQEGSSVDGFHLAALIQKCGGQESFDDHVLVALQCLQSCEGGLTTNWFNLDFFDGKFVAKCYTCNDTRSIFAPGVSGQVSASSDTCASTL